MTIQRVALALSLACLPLPAAAQAAKTDPAISKILKEFSSAAGAKDAAKIASLYTEDAVFYPPNEPAVRGRAAIQGWMQKMFDQGVQSLALTGVESRVLGDVAYSVENYTLTVKTPGGLVTDKGKAIVIYKQVGGKWLLAHDIFNSDLPPAPAPPPAKK
jgi:uncharacterized protein (TIGR02246 family)